MALQRKMVLHEKVYVDLYDILDGNSIEEAMLKLQALQTTYEPLIIDRGYEVKFDIQHWYDEFSVHLDVYRPETDDEMAKREAKAAKARETARKRREAEKEKAREKLYKKEQDERAEYERLRAKFGSEGAK